MRCILVLLCLVSTSLAATMYAKVDDVYRRDLVPVSSTVIPLEDLEYTVGVGLGVHSTKGSKYKKPTGDTSLITAAGKKKSTPQEKAYVKKLTKADFERF